MDTSPNSLPSTELVQLNRKLNRLVELSVYLNSTLDLDQLLRLIIETAAELLDCEAASILLYDDQKGELSFCSAAGSDPQQLAQIPVPLEGSLAGAIFRENRPLVINDVGKDPRHFSQVGERIQFPPRSLLGVPMCIRERATGVLEALNKRQGEFTPADTRLLSILASQAAVAIQNARLVQALQKAYDELSRIDRMKNDFMAIASHELRTPLGVILGYATFLKDEAQGELSEHARLVFDSALRMRSVIDAMTNMAMLQMGGMDLQLASVPLQPLLQAAVQDVMPAAAEKSQTIRVDLPDQEVTVLADAEKLRKAFANILNNAVRFTQEKGDIQLSLSATPEAARVEIRDNGVGIEAEELENIFKQFYQVEGHMTRRYGGLGLGLAITRGVIELHNGRIWAESAGPEKGSTFIVILPINC